jgi:hypothetical protein
MFTHLNSILLSVRELALWRRESAMSGWVDASSGSKKSQFLATILQNLTTIFSTHFKKYYILAIF